MTDSLAPTAWGAPPGERLFAQHPPPGAFFASLEPREFSFFVDAPVTDLLRCVERTTRISPTTRVIEDHYRDTALRSLAAHGSSLRVRTYLAPRADLFFDIVWLSWIQSGVEDCTGGARTNTVVVQSFEGNGMPDYERQAEFYERAGLHEIYRVRKTRHKFEFAPMRFHEVRPGQHDSFMHLSHLATTFIETDDVGLRVLVDELETPVRGATVVLEIEFGRQHETEATRLLDALRAALDPALVEKRLNKIRYILDGSDSYPADSPPA